MCKFDVAGMALSEIIFPGKIAMKHILLIFLAPLLLFTAPCMARGHGGGGHGGGHGGHGGHSGGHGGSYGSAHGSLGWGSRNTGSSPARTAAPLKAYAPIHNYRGAATNPVKPAATVAGNTPAVQGGRGYYPPEYGYGYGYPFSYYPYDPFYDPFFMMNFGMSMMYSPHYNYMYPPANGNSPDENEEETINEMGGYVVFQMDTLKGKVSINQRAVSLETADSVRNYDYVFNIKKDGLKYVTVYNTDSSQLNLVRLADAPRRLLRVVHEGKLNIYDGRHKFIYHPDDIDVKSLVVVYNGAVSYIHAVSAEEAKIRISQFVNMAYGLDLDPRSFSWKELLIYIDKLD
jgi:hypothetical protein